MAKAAASLSAVGTGEQKMCKNHPDRPGHKNRRLCLECLQENARKSAEIRKANNQARKIAEQVESPPARPPQAIDADQGDYAEIKGDKAVTLDFSGYPELWEKLNRRAKKNFRTLEGEFFFLLDIAL